MKLEDFNNLSEEERTTLLNTYEANEKTISELTAERDSFKKENETLIKQMETANSDLKATKELNFTLARKINANPKKDCEETLHDFMKGF